ncbi:MAG: hypothetical protein AABX73_04085 [Nanoarchaeota archaeon]
MVKKESYGNSANFYAGADYGFDSSYGKEFSLNMDAGYNFPASQFALTTDPRSANQLLETSKKLSTGAKVIEITGIQMNILDSIPKQHFKEINRLKKLTGVDMTFHGPLIEPTGIGQGGWDPTQREFAERQISSAVERAHDLDPDGNIVITFHSSNGLPEPRTKVKTEDGKEISTSLAVVDERTGRFGALPRPTKNYLTGEEPSPDKELERLNTQNWSTELSNVNISASRGREAFRYLNQLKDEAENDESLKGLSVESIYNIANSDKGKEFLDSLEPGAQKIAERLINNLSHADIYARDSYRGFQELFNQAYEAAEKVGNDIDKGKLEKLREEILPSIENYKEDRSKIVALSEAVTKGIRVLDSIKPPQIFQPLEKFAIDKASETFANTAFNAYKKFGDTSPIISIENPPAGSGLSRAEDLRELIKASREKFARRLVEKQGFSEGEAEKQAEKLIGATWDVGHINMIRKFGYDESDVIAESKKIAPFVKHVHLSDNFGLEHTELPMGMGNVPTKKILELDEQFRKAKKVIETGGPWFQFFQKSPLMETFRAFGSPLYAMKMGPYWNQAANATGGYFAGYGQTLPEQHFNIYGAGFSNLPPELGGQMGGRARMGGAPIE